MPPVRGPLKSYVSAYVDRSTRGRALGTHGAATGISSLVGAVLAGVIWFDGGRTALFAAAAIAAAAATMQLRGPGAS